MNRKEPAATQNPTAFENFRALTKKVISVPKSKIDEREVKYRNGRKTKNRRRHR